MTTTESEWDPHEQGWMLALAEWEAGRCPVCGGDPDECWAAESERAYEVPLPIRCHRATAIAAARKEYDTNSDVRAPGALIFWAERRGAGTWPTGPSQSG